MKVQVTKVPQLRGGGMFGPQTPPTDTYRKDVYKGNDPEIKVARVLKPTTKENATLEAEKNETVITNLQQDGIPEFYTIGGKPHSKGGTPLNLPANSFFFSQTPEMRIRDKEVLDMFNSGRKVATPAGLSKQYDLNPYREILENPYSTPLEKETAQQMIKNFNLKLGKLALVQESMKGFNKGIPAVAMGYMEDNNISPAELIMPAGAPGVPAQKFKTGGDYTGGRKVKITGLPQYKEAGPVVNRWDPSKDGYNESQVKVGDLIKQPDGSWKAVKARKQKDYTGPVSTDKTLGKYNNAYSRLYTTFQDPKVRENLVVSYRKQVAQLKPDKNLTQADIDAMQNLQPEEIVDNFLYGQKSNMALNNKLGDPTKDSWDKDPNEVNAVLTEIGYKPRTKLQTAAFQAAYNGLNDLYQNPETQGTLKDFKMFQTGVANDKVTGEQSGSVSGVDGFLGNTTAGQFLLPADSELELQDVKDSETTDIKHLKDTKQAAQRNWWTPDVVNLASATTDYLQAKKYDPWQATPEYEQANPQFTDFRGSAARINSLGAGLARQAATFTGPQAQAAMHSNIQRNMIDPILQTQENENRMNIGVANQFALTNAQAKNQFNQLKGQQDTQLYDKYTIANQQFDNTKRALKWNMVNMFNNGWNNAGKTQALNSMTQQYQVNPTLGTLEFTNGLDLDPQKDPSTALFDKAKMLKRENPDMDWDQAFKAVGLNGQKAEPTNVRDMIDPTMFYSK
jgi:hypothetical protein